MNEQERIEFKDAQDILKVDRLVKVYTKKDSNPSEENSNHQTNQINERPDDDYNVKNHKKDDKKIYNVAVKGISFGVARGETFALLGVNGAGKSSTFNCMMGKETISGGNVWLNGLDMRSALGQPYLLQGRLGYCP